MLTRTTPALSPELERLVTRTIGCAIRVHHELGPGLAEGLYQDALGIELRFEGLAYSKEVPVTVMYRGHPLRKQRLDLVVERQIVVELKAVDHLDRVHHAQLLSYLRASRLPVGLLMNFHAEFLKAGLKRLIL